MKIWEMNLTITGWFQTCIVQPDQRDDGNQVNVPCNPRNPRYGDPWVVQPLKAVVPGIVLKIAASVH